jgi:capsular exopolysaccharide synthesis family protein
MSDENEIELSWIFSTIRRRSRIIAGFVLVTVILAFLATLVMAPVYKSTVTLLIQPAKDSQTSEYTSIITGEQLALTYSQLLESGPVLEAVISKLGLKDSPDQLADKITAAPIKDTQLIRLTVTGSSPVQTASLANALAEELIAHIQKLQAERYNASMAELENRMNNISASIDELTVKINTLNTNKVTYDVEQGRLQRQLDAQQTNYRSLQDNYQQLQLTVSQITDKVKIVEAAHISNTSDQGLNTATLMLLVDPSLVIGTGSSSSLSASERLMLIYGPMLKSQPVLDAAIRKLGLSETVDQLARQITIESVAGTQLLQLSVVDKDTSKATLIADTVAGIFIEQVQSLLAQPYNDQLQNLQKQIEDLTAQMSQTQEDIRKASVSAALAQAELTQQENLLADYKNDYRALQGESDQLRLTLSNAADSVVVSSPAQIPSKPERHRLTYIAIAALVGLVTGAGAALIVERLGNKIWTKEDVVEATGLHILGSVSSLPEGEPELVYNPLSASLFAEDFRKLSASLRLSQREAPLGMLLITSPSSQEGKTIVAANLAVALAKAGLRALLVDADLHLPRVHQLFGLDQDGGLTDYLKTGSWEELIKSTQTDQLKVLTSGQVPENLADAFSAPNLDGLMIDLKNHFDVVIVDCPPVLAVADTAILASLADNVLLVLRSGQASSQSAREAVNALNQAKAHLMGVILNDVKPHRDGYYYHYYVNEGDGKAKTLYRHSKNSLLIILNYVKKQIQYQIENQPRVRMKKRLEKYVKDKE